jgi:hypothetical protein
MSEYNYFTWDKIRRATYKEEEVFDILEHIDDLLEKTKEGRISPREAVETIKDFLNKSQLPPSKKEIEKPFIKIEFLNHLSYETGTDLNIPITKDNKVIGFVKDIYETRCIGYIFTKCIDIIPEIMIDEKRVMSFIVREGND